MKKSDVKIPESFLKKIEAVHARASKIFGELSPEALALVKSNPSKETAPSKMKV